MMEFLSLLLRVIYRSSHSLTNSIRICRKGLLTPLAMLPNPVMPNRLLQSNRNSPKIRGILRFVQPFETQTKSWLPIQLALGCWGSSSSLLVVV
ncbi:hypothetical protein I7I53_03463 [Histoplasma capsulatum var. duboisii H88]|uniref:Uncharacterized protein n=1 Tax=Ajellomyces capsulatus (strain H88) TaxID=544711 RepID=A0A8A1LTY8_AJEC8|nr:hypothetical protein I7I53_03463 [Histoplasma capsulatum var. duboisii H88]